MTSIVHKEHIAKHISHNNCPECRADNSRWHAQTRTFRHADVPADALRKYLRWIRPRLAAIRDGNNTVDAQRWQRDFVAALHNRLYSQMAGSGRKFAPDYAKYHLATYGNDFHFLHNL
jgi:hypothetical protein